MQHREEWEKVINLGLIHIVDNDRDIKTIFNKKTYEKEFLKFYKIYSQALDVYNKLYEYSGQPEAFADEVAEKIMAHEMKKINGIEKKSKRGMQMMEDSAFAALFVIPAIDRYRTPATDQLADLLVEKWRTHFPKNQIQRGQFDSINEGFKRKRKLFGIFG